VFVSPGDTFRSVAAHPTWLGVLLVSVVTTAALWFWFLGTEAGQQGFMDQQVRQMEAFGRPMNDEQYSAMQQSLPMMKYFVVGSQVVLGPVMTFIVAGILFAVFNAGLGGEASYKQVLAIVAHAGVITIGQSLFTIPINYARESMSSATNLAIFLPMLDEGSLVARFLGMIDLFLIWWLIVLAIGLGVLYRRRTTPIALSLLGVYVVIVAIIATVMRLSAGSQ
jgi:hypothetical protein